MTDTTWTKKFKTQWDEAIIVLAGLGREGRSSHQFIESITPNTNFILSDAQPQAKIDSYWTELLDHHPEKYQFSTLSKLETTIADLSQRNQKVIIFRSPGIAPETIPYDHTNQQLHMTSNVDIFFKVIAQLQSATPQTNLVTIGVTGTKGKSTTTMAIQHVLEQSGISSILCGNIGIPPLDMIAEIVTQLEQPKSLMTVVLELSAHQLQDLEVSPNIAVIQAITPEHLDYYASFERYQTAKRPIIDYQTQDDLVLVNADNPTAVALAAATPSQHLLFSLQSQKADCYLKDNQIYAQNEKIISETDSNLPGKHNLYNLMPAILIALHVGISKTVIATALKSFVGLPHRLQFVAKVDGVDFYNDSLATTPEATQAALEAFQPGSIILIAGGYDRGLDYAGLATTILEQAVQSVLVFEPSGARLLEAIRQAVDSQVDNQASTLQLTPTLYTVNQMTAAVEQAAALAKPGATVLLSPASPSFGLFKDYQDRGEQFAAAVKKL